MIKLRFFPWAWYVGAFYSTRYGCLYIHPIPFVGLQIRIKEYAAPAYEGYAMK